MTPTPRRWVTLDIARALAVIGVVLNHAVDGLLAAGLLDPEGAIANANAALYLFRMPALAFLLGIFIPRGVEKRGKFAYLRYRSYTVLWVYLLWTLLQGGIQVALSSVTNGHMTTARVLTLWVPIAQFWFLPALITTTAAVVFLHTWGRLAWLRVAILLVPAMALWGSAPNIAGIHGFSLVFFVGAGAAVGLRGYAKLATLSPGFWAAAGAVAAAILALLVMFPLAPATTWTYPALPLRALSIVCAADGVVLVLAVAMLISKVPGLGTSLASIGRQTMPIYLMHILILAAVRIAYLRLGFTSPEIFFVIAIPLAVAVPWLVGKEARRLRLSWLFEAPRVKQKSLNSTR